MGAGRQRPGRPRSGQIVVAAEIGVESLDTVKLQPMVHAALDGLGRVGVSDTPRVLADGGYGPQHPSADRR
ncbi:MAG: hypothetical protein JWP17_269, partial [Solirubrobacterales bacterium]|nr:hypothetical protein [Solirubrobacterales bacterium]